MTKMSIRDGAVSVSVCMSVSVDTVVVHSIDVRFRFMAAYQSLCLVIDRTPSSKRILQQLNCKA